MVSEGENIFLRHHPKLVLVDLLGKTSGMVKCVVTCPGLSGEQL